MSKKLKISLYGREAKITGRRFDTPNGLVLKRGSNTALPSKKESK